jgi:hypothetical protein
MGEIRLARVGGGAMLWIHMMRLSTALFAGILSLAAAQAQSPYQSSSDFAKYAMKLREESLLQLEPQVIIPTESNKAGVRGLYPWHLSIYTTVFWVGESASTNNPVHNFSSSWDREWWKAYGGNDGPNGRRALPDGGSIPSGFIPQQNPFYFALPYNDVERGSHKVEARRVIPWFNQVFEKEGQSVLRDRWIAIRKNFPNGSSRVCYAQWSDCGPFRTDHHSYVFGDGRERPLPNLNKGAGLDVSPAVRDYLGMGMMEVLDWKFVEFRDVPVGPWARFGDNNTFVIESRRNQLRVAQAEKRAPKPKGEPKPVTKDDLPLPKAEDDGPAVITR